MELRDNFEVESFYQFMEEHTDWPPIMSVECDDNPELCADCEKEKAMIEVHYRKKVGEFKIKLCMKCYADPDHQLFKSKHEIINIRKL